MPKYVELSAEETISTSELIGRALSQSMESSPPKTGEEDDETCP